MSRFKVGDLIIGNSSNTYSVTSKRSVCLVLKILDTPMRTGENINVTVIHDFRYGNSEFYNRFASFEVDDMNFDLFDPSNEVVNDSKGVHRYEKTISKLLNKTVSKERLKGFGNKRGLNISSFSGKVILSLATNEGINLTMFKIQSENERNYSFSEVLHFNLGLENDLDEFFLFKRKVDEVTWKTKEIRLKERNSVEPIPWSYGDWVRAVTSASSR